MERLIITVLIALLSVGETVSQDYNVIEKTPLKPHTINFQQIDEDYFPTVRQIEAPGPGGEEADEKLKAIKENIGPKRQTGRNKRKQNSGVKVPKTVKGFDGNEPDGVPNDNDIAINQNGQIVSVTNSLICIYDTAGNQLDQHSLASFADTLDINGRKYDPRVEYDPEADRFVIAFLNGTLDTTSRIILGFSASSDPLEDWNLYSLPGDAVDNGSWSDFPAMALTKDELFLTVNLLYNDSSWQSGFRQSIVWQLDKTNGYQGHALSQKVYSDITVDGERIRNLTPIQGGSELKGPEMHLLSNINFTEQSRKFYLATITGKQDNPNTSLTTKEVLADNPYGTAPEADQPGGETFETNDARILDGYIEDNTIHFVGNSIDFSNNKAGIYHGRLEDPANAENLELYITTAPCKELGYPSIAYGGKTNGEHEGLILANHTGDTTFPGYSGLRFQGMNHSAVRTLKEGSSRVDRQRANSERWGDYSGLQARYNGSRTYWASGYYGFQQTIFNQNGTWISRITRGETVGKADPPKDKSAVKAYPNPMQNRLKVGFEIDKPQVLQFLLFNSKGQKVRKLKEQFTHPGTHNFQFSVAPLPKGQYVLKIKGAGKVIATRKLVK